jgi:hypothetical protein
MADFETRTGVARAGGMTGARDLITTSSIMRWLAEGKVFSAGLGPEETAVDSAAALADVSPTFGLFSPSGNSTVVVPLYASFSMTGEGGALQVCQAAFTKAAANCGTAMTKSGTALSKQNCNSMFTTAGSSSALHTITVSALTTSDYLSIKTLTAADNLITTAGGAQFANTVVEIDFTKHPVILAEGAAFLFYAYTGTTDSTWVPFIYYAEVSPSDIY